MFIEHFLQAKGKCNLSASQISKLQVRADGTALMLLDPVTVRVLVDQARASKKNPAALAVKMLKDALENATYLRDARRTLSRIKSGKEKTTPWRKSKVVLGL